MTRNAMQKLATRIKKALHLAGDTHSIEDVARAIQSGEAQAWTKNASILVTEIIETSMGRYLHILLAAGDMQDVAELQREACDAAREIGCTKATFFGRRGWERHPITKDEGWEPISTVFFKEL